MQNFGFSPILLYELKDLKYFLHTHKITISLYFFTSLSGSLIVTASPLLG